MVRPASSGASSRPASRRSSSTPVSSRPTSTVGMLLNHEPPARCRDHIRDNVLAMREKAKQKKAQREEEASREKPPFKLRQFENMPSRFHQEQHSSISSSHGGYRSIENRSPNRHAGAGSGGYPQTPPDRPPAWRVSNGYGSLSSYKQELLASPVTPPRAAARSSRIRAFSTPAKSPQFRPSRRRNTTVEVGSEEDGLFDYEGFEQVSHLQHQKHGAKQNVRSPVGSSREAYQPQGPLSHCGEADHDAVPPGYRLLPEEERLDSLRSLQSKLKELDDKYCRLPLRIETEGQRQQQEQLRKLITEAERAVAVFSRQSVVVQI